MRLLCLVTLQILLSAALLVGQGTNQTRTSVNGSVAGGSLVTAAATKYQVRFTALTLARSIRLQVLSQAGDHIYDSGYQAGNRLEWQVQDQQGSGLRDGVYGCLVSVGDLDGQTSHRWATFQVRNATVSFDSAGQEEQAGTADEVERLTILWEQKGAPFTFVSHDGKEGWIESASGGLSFSAGSLSRNREAAPHLRLTPEGNLGIGVAEPQAKLDVAGLIKASEGFQFSDGTVLKMRDGYPVFVTEAPQRTESAGGKFEQAGPTKQGTQTIRALGGVVFAASNSGGIYKYSSDTTSNTSYGLNAGNANIGTNGGAYNSLFGYNAGNKVTSGWYNTLLGTYAGYNLTTSNASVLVGPYAGYSTTGAYNAFFGADTGYNTGAGTYNSFFGPETGYWNTGGSYNSALGAYAGPPSGSGNLTNATAIGSRAQVTQSNSLVLGSINGVNGAAADTNVGIGTTSPELQLHLTKGDTPAVRLEQTAGTWPAQKWDVAGNESNFFIRDVTNGSKLPFRIHPGAPTSSIEIAASGNVGIGTTSPQQMLSVAGGLYASGNVGIGTTNPVSLLHLKSPARENAYQYFDTTTPGWDAALVFLSGGSSKWQINNMGDWGDLRFYSYQKPGEVMRLTASGTTSMRGEVFIGAAGGVAARLRANEWSSHYADFGYADAEGGAYVQGTTSDAAGNFNINPDGGNVGIGTTNPTAKLHVAGSIKASAYLVGAPDMELPDYVFEPSYTLMPIHDLARFLEEQKHLPNVPSAQEMREKGLNLGDFQMKLLQKIEELTLYTVQQAKTHLDQQSALERKDAEISSLNARLAALEQTLELMARKEEKK